jgi:hypothetical protein
LEQVTCLQAKDGWDMMPSFDRLPLRLQIRVRNSPFNLCCGCIVDTAMKLRVTLPDLSWDELLLQAIERMENQIRCEEV